jgi:hypothetical protein
VEDALDLSVMQSAEWVNEFKDVRIQVFWDVSLPFGEWLPTFQRNLVP